MSAGKDRPSPASGADRHQRKRAAIAAKLEADSGRSVAAWIALAERGPAEGFMATVDWLKAEHGLTHFQARLVAEHRRDRGQGRPDPE